MDHEPVEAAAVFSATFLKEYFGGTTKLRRKIQKALNEFAFKHDGSIRAALVRIAEGNGSAADLDTIAYHLRDTQDRTAQAYEWLRYTNPKIAKLLSAHYAMKLEAVAYKKMGQFTDGIRTKLRSLVRTKDLSPHHAKTLLEQIDEFNELLEKLK